jgi:hypothetical protein
MAITFGLVNSGINSVSFASKKPVSSSTNFTSLKMKPVKENDNQIFTGKFLHEIPSHLFHPIHFGINLNSHRISFTSNNNFKPIYGNITIEYAKDIVSSINSGNTTNLFEGWAGTVYRIDDSAIKVPKNDKTESILQEAKILDLIKDIPGVQQLKSFFQLNNRYYLITNFIEGENIYDRLMKNDRVMDKIHFNSLMQTIGELEKNNIYNGDLHEGNIILNNNHTTILDFGDAHVMTPELIQKNLDKNNLFEIYRNPYTCMVSNLECFELRSMAPYLTRISYKFGDKKAEEQLTNYLNSVSQYNKTMAKYFVESNNIEAANYENKLAKIYSNPSTEVKKAEILKIQLKHIAKEIEFAQNAVDPRPNNLIRLQNLEQLTLNSKVIAATILKNLNILEHKFPADSPENEYCTINKDYIYRFMERYFNLKQKSELDNSPILADDILIDKETLSLLGNKYL